MKIKINPDKKAEEWHVGDVIANKNYSHLALIVKDFKGNYVAMDIGEGIDDFRFSLEENSTWTNPCSTIQCLRDNLSEWHKVDATLIVNGDIKQDED